VWLDELSWCRHHCPLPLVSPLPPNCMAQPLQNLHDEMISNPLSRLYERCTKLDVKNSGNFLTSPRIPDTLCQP
jgi:hypothetical protein